jgi:dolichyl-phosphate beta-glucosyltransferase
VGRDHTGILPPQSRPFPARSEGRSLSIVIPAYNEERRLPATLRAIHDFLVERRYDAEVIVVDDGSQDGTPAVLRGLSTEIPLLRTFRFPKNHGKGFAVRTGVLKSERGSVLLCDADLSTPIGEVERLWTHYDLGIPVVIGSRYMARSRDLVEQTCFRRCFGRLSNLVISLIGIRGIKDTQCGFKLLRGDVARRILAATKTEGFSFDVEVLLRARREGFAIREVPVRWTEAPGSKVRPLRDAVRSLAELLSMRGF